MDTELGNQKRGFFVSFSVLLASGSGDEPALSVRFPLSKAKQNPEWNTELIHSA